MRRLRSTLLKGGRLYPAGSEISDVLAAKVESDVFEADYHRPDPEDLVEEESGDPAPHGDDPDDDARQVVAGLIREAVDQAVAPLLERIEQLQATVPDTAPVTSPAGDTAPGRITKDYDDHRVAELRGEVDARNAGLEPDSTGYVTVAEPGNKPDLVAALEAHDATKAAEA